MVATEKKRKSRSVAQNDQKKRQVAQHEPKSRPVAQHEQKKSPKVASRDHGTKIREDGRRDRA